jgi:tetrapyrrole methylase family protein/MazG family protein
MAVEVRVTASACTADALSAARDGAPQDAAALARAERTVWRLMEPDGCPWDRAQTHTSIRANMLEEAYEAASAIDEASEAHLCEELGDVLLQVLLQAEIARRDGEFSLEDVANGLVNKLVRRHPHVFGDDGRGPAAVEAAPAGKNGEVAAVAANAQVAPNENLDGVMSSAAGAAGAAGAGVSSAAGATGTAAAHDANDVLGIWEQVKAKERAEQEAAGTASGAAGAAGEASTQVDPTGVAQVAKALPACMRAQKIAKRLHKAGVVGPTYLQLLDAVDLVEDELLLMHHPDYMAPLVAGCEPAGAAPEHEPTGSAEELTKAAGSLLFLTCMWLQEAGVDAEEALRAASSEATQLWLERGTSRAHGEAPAAGGRPVSAIELVHGLV